MADLGRLLDSVLGRALSAAKWLAIPIGLLLFLQWPLRDFLQMYSRDANDLGQWLFAIYVAASVTAATRSGTHLATDALARHYSARARRVLARLCNVLALAPWALFILVTATPMIRSSIVQLERFPDTGNFGYFIVKLSLWLLAACSLTVIAIDALGSGKRSDGQ